MKLGFSAWNLWFFFEVLLDTPTDNKCKSQARKYKAGDIG